MLTPHTAVNDLEDMLANLKQEDGLHTVSYFLKTFTTAHMWRTGGSFHGTVGSWNQIETCQVCSPLHELLLNLG